MKVGIQKVSYYNFEQKKAWVQTHPGLIVIYSRHT